MAKKKTNKRVDQLIKDSKLRGGRASQIIKDKKIYSRKQHINMELPDDKYN